MLRTNSKEVKNRVKAYIIENVGAWYEENAEYFEEQGVKELTALNPESFEDMAKALQVEFEREYYSNPFHKKHIRFDMFISWAQGLPLNGTFDFYYNIEAKPIVKAWLEETDAEANRHTEREAERLLTSLIYRESFNAFCK